jgi:hypothetical protein
LMHREPRERPRAELQLMMFSHRVKSLLQKASSTAGYLRMITPKKPAEEEGRKKFVFINGQAIEGGSGEKRDRARYTNWHGGNLDPDSVARHQHNLTRVGFKDNADCKGVF